MNVLCIGRYQVLHLGHVDQIMQAAKIEGIEKLIIGIGTSNEKDFRDPFSFEERKAMLLPVLKQICLESSVPFLIYEIPDINNPPKYAEYVKSLIPGFNEKDILCSGNSYTTSCFPNRIFIPQRRFSICATAIREAIATGEKIDEKMWQEYVPMSTVAALQSIGGIDKIKRFYFSR